MNILREHKGNNEEFDKYIKSLIIFQKEDAENKEPAQIWQAFNRKIMMVRCKLKITLTLYRALQLLPVLWKDPKEIVRSFHQSEHLHLWAETFVWESV